METAKTKGDVAEPSGQILWHIPTDKSRVVSNSVARPLPNMGTGLLRIWKNYLSDFLLNFWDGKSHSFFINQSEIIAQP